MMVARRLYHAGRRSESGQFENCAVKWPRRTNSNGGLAAITEHDATDLDGADPGLPVQSAHQSLPGKLARRDVGCGEPQRLHDLWYERAR